MSVYRRILLVVDLTEQSVTIGRRAQALAAALGAEVELLHVVEFVPVEPMGETLLPSVQIEEELLERARLRLAALAGELGLAGAAWPGAGDDWAPHDVCSIRQSRARPLTLLSCTFMSASAWSVLQSS